MKLADSQKSSLKMLLQSPQWKIVEYVMEEYIRMVSGNSSVRETNEETLRETYLKEGKIQGIRELIQEILKEIT